jgi:protease-4
MSKEKPGLIKRFFALIGKLFTALRWLINAVFLLLMITVLVSLFGPGLKPLPDQAALTLVPSGTLVEERSYTDPLTQLMSQGSKRDAETPIRDLIDAIDSAASDPRITSLVLKLDYLAGGGIAKLQEMGTALARFRESGKPIVAVSSNYTQEQYFLASFADEIHLDPMGAVMLVGYGYYGNYFKNAADKLKVRFHVFKAGKYKSAVEPFTRSDMSEAARENTRSWLTGLWSAYTGAVEERRSLPAGAVDDYVNNLPSRMAEHGGNLSRVALEANLVDRISDGPAVRQRLQDLAGEADDDYRHVDHKEYLAHVRLGGTGGKEGTPEGRIGVIVASGTILDGEQPAGTIGGESLARLLRQARQDESLDALVLRIDSPGGSAFASETIRAELLETREKLPVFVSMGSLAASGGYWIAANATEIWAMPTTLTGSIGVFGIVPTFGETLESMGIDSDGVGTTELADIYRLDRPLSPQGQRIIQLTIEDIYGKFLALVAEGRGSTPEKIEEIAGGRVWTGKHALDVGLVDHLGSLKDTVAAAAEKAGVARWRVKYITPPLTFQERLLKQLSGEMGRFSGAGTSLVEALPAPLDRRARELALLFREISRLNDPRGAYLQCFACPEEL